MKKINDIDFFRVDAKDLAKKLIGKWIVTIVDGQERRAQICETEAYLGKEDSACHSYKGKFTNRNQSMWKDGGTIYVYLCYGFHYLLNIVSNVEGEPKAVLIRGVVNFVGPAKTTKFFNIDKSFDGQSVIDNPRIHLEDDGKKYSFTKAKRVGIDFSLPKDKNALLRFVMKMK